MCAESITEEICLAGKEDVDIKEFSNKSYQTKKKIINNAVDDFVKTDVRNIINENTDMRTTYAPAFSSSTSSSKVCSLYNAQGQGAYGLCWAAAVATICNYLNGTNITAKNVADEMNVGYDDGALPEMAQEALSRYMVRYNNINLYASEVMTWESYKINVNNKYPIYVRALASGGDHAVVAYGYMIAAGVRYITIWNSGVNGGTGSSTTLMFRDYGTTFTYNNKTYTWAHSVSKY